MAQRTRVVVINRSCAIAVRCGASKFDFRKKLGDVGVNVKKEVLMFYEPVWSMFAITIYARQCSWLMSVGEENVKSSCLFVYECQSADSAKYLNVYQEHAPVGGVSSYLLVTQCSRLMSVGEENVKSSCLFVYECQSADSAKYLNVYQEHAPVGGVSSYLLVTQCSWLMSVGEENVKSSCLFVYECQSADSAKYLNVYQEHAPVGGVSSYLLVTQCSRLTYL
ncbi:hypothetical protein J6590_042682 [Homalodisca vitripennis]|nr:hypothetical protein J6590_042682 [Homalodisca vitripennis]